MRERLKALLSSTAEPPQTHWRACLAPREIFKNPKPSTLLEQVLSFVTQDDVLVADIVAGSGTTGHPVINLNREDNGRRKYVLMEMGNHFDTILKPRLQKVAFSETLEIRRARTAGQSACAQQPLQRHFAMPQSNSLGKLRRRARQHRVQQRCRSRRRVGAGLPPRLRAALRAGLGEQGLSDAARRRRPSTRLLTTRSPCGANRARWR